MSEGAEALIEVSSVSMSFKIRGGGNFFQPAYRTALKSVSVAACQGEILAVVGESGSGKSTLSRIMLGLLTQTEGNVCYRGVSLTRMTKQQRYEYRRAVQPVFQDPSASLNPSMTVGQTLAYMLRSRGKTGASAIRHHSAKALESVGLIPGDGFIDRFPSQLSGGQQQRVAIARAMLSSPSLIVADEPLSSLDMSVQAQIVRLIRHLRAESGVGFVIISHDLNMVRALADRVVIMNEGEIVEGGEVSTVFQRPEHPYTRELLRARLSGDPRARTLTAD